MILLDLSVSSMIFGIHCLVQMYHTSQIWIKGDVRLMLKTEQPHNIN